MKTKRLLLFSACIALALGSCKKTPSNTVIKIPISNPIKQDTLAGHIKGTLLANKTYYAKNNLFVNKGDTLLLQQGAKLLFFGAGNSGKGGSSYSLYCSGVLISQGTKANPCVFSTSSPNPRWPAGYWGGITMDSASTYLNLQWTKVSYTGAADTVYGNQYGLSILGVGAGSTPGKFISNTKVFVENCTFEYGYDDVIRMQGPIQVEIRGNVFRKEGGPDGDGVTAKNGVRGDFCYNYVWSGANNSLKSDEYTTDATKFCTINCFNNTVISGGWRKQGEASAGMKFGDFTKVSVYNNIVANCRNGIRLVKTIDTTYLKGKYDYNYIFVVVDSTLGNEYPIYDYGRPQPHDILSKKAGDKNPMFVKFDPNVDQPAVKNVVGSGIIYSDANDPHLQTSSPAVGAGTTSPLGGVNPFNFDGSTKWLPGKDMGAFQTNGSGNQVLN